MSYSYPGQPSSYGTYQTSAAGVPQQQRQPQGQAVPSPQVHFASTQATPQASNYPQQSAYPTYGGGVPQVIQQGFADPQYAAAAGYTQGTPSFPVAIPHPAPNSGSSHHRSHSGQPSTLYPTSGGSMQRSPSGQSATLYPTSGGSMQRSPAGQSATLYPSSGGSIRRSRSQRSPSGQPATLYPHAAGGSIQRSPAGQSATLYPSAGGSVQRSHSQRSPAGQSAILYAQAPTGSSVQHGYSGQSAAHHYPPAPPSYDATSTSYPGPQPTLQTQQTQHVDPYGYDNEGHMNENRPKSPGHGPAQGRQYTCRLPNCNRPMFFDRRANEFWEWCSPQHIQTALGRGMEKVCRHCGVWPRKYSYKYCGGPSCNKQGVPLPRY